MFGTESASGFSGDGRLLPACPTVNEWNSGGGIRGVNLNLASNIRNTEYNRTRIANELAGEAREGVARQMLDDSVRILQELSRFISTHYHEVWTRWIRSAGGSFPTAFARSAVVSVRRGRPASARSQEERRRLRFFGGHSKVTVPCERCSLTASRATRN